MPQPSQNKLPGLAEMPPQSGGASSLTSVVGICFFLALAVWLVFGQTVQYEFVNYDDNILVYDHPVIKEGVYWAGVVWAFTHSDDGHWAPLNKLSHMVVCQIFGLKPAGHHLTNVLLHAANAILLFLALRTMTGAVWRSAFVAAVFAVHPLRVESVAWVSERKDVLSGLFFFLALWTYGSWVRRKQFIGQLASVGEPTYQRRPLSSVYYGLTLLFFGCGLMSKVSVAPLPILLLVLDYWPLNRFAFPASLPAKTEQKRPPIYRRLVFEKLPFLAILLMAGVALLLSLDNYGARVLDEVLAGRGFLPTIDTKLSEMTRTGHALLTPLVYLKQMFYPAGLAVASPPSQSVALWQVLTGVLLCAAISTVAFRLRYRHSYLLVGWLWYLVILAPVLLMIQRGSQTRCDRYTYLAQIGLYIMVTWGAFDLCASWRHRRAVFCIAATMVFAFLLAVARVQTTYWHNSISLWKRALAVTSENYVAHSGLGIALGGEGRLIEAISHLERALELKPNCAEIHKNLGVALAAQGTLPAAIQHYERAIQLKPDYAEAHFDFGNVLAAQEKLDEAVRLFERAIQLKPDYVVAHYNLANILTRQERLNEAIQHYELALRFKPGYGEACNNLGRALIKKGQPAEAIQYFEKALSFQPDNIAARVNLGNTLAAQGRLEEAILQFRHVLRSEADSVEAHFHLGRAVAQAGKLGEAIQYFQRALNLAKDQGNSALAEAVQAELKSHQSALPEP